MPISQHKTDKTEVRILWIGDSVINGGNLTDHDSLATTILENKLKKQWKTPVRVMNVSAGSWGPKNMLAYFKKFGAFDADIVVITISSHDVQDHPTFKPLNPQTHPVHKPISALYEGIIRYLPRYLPTKKNSLVDDVYLINKSKVELVLPEYKKLLDLLSNEVKRVYVIHHSERKELEKRVLSDGARLLHNVTLECNVPWYFDSSAFSQDVEKNFRDDIHPSNSGQRQLVEVLLSNVLIDDEKYHVK